MNYSNIVPYQWVFSSTVTNTNTRHSIPRQNVNIGCLYKASKTGININCRYKRTKGVHTITVLNNQGNKITMAAFTKELKQYIYFNQAYTSGHSHPQLQ